MTSVQEAAARLRIVKATKWPSCANWQPIYDAYKGVSYGDWSERIDKDRSMLADAYLELADDAEPISEPWLKSIGFHNSWDQGYLSKRYCIAIAPLWHWPACGDLKPLWQIGFAHRETATAEFETIPTLETRGDVRRLCAFLGIPLSESPQEPT